MPNKTDKKNCALPANAQLSMNHCNLPAKILGGLTFNLYPVKLVLDSVHDLYKNLFNYLNKTDNFDERLRLFNKTMQAHFQLNDLTQVGFSDSSNFNRSKMNYQRIILGWHMNPDGFEAAVLKRWVESRFGLSPRFHKTPLRNFTDAEYDNYLYESAVGLYNSNAIESQLDVLYSYCQYELGLQLETHLTLYRGLNHLNEHEVLEKNGNQLVLLLNNINSFSASAELAEHFGDYVIKIDVPIYKIFCYNPILPGQINSEEEYIVLGGLYQAILLK